MESGNTTTPSTSRRIARSTVNVVGFVLGMAVIVLLCDFVIGLWTVSPISQIRADRIVADAKDLWKQGELDAALARFSKAIEIDPRNDETYFCRGQVYVARGDSERAYADFIESTGQAKSKAMFSKSLLSLGILDAEAGRTETAMQRLSDAIESNPKLTNAFAARANLYSGQEQYDQALVDLDRAISLDPHVAYLYVDRALVHAQLGNSGRATADAEKAIELDPDAARANMAMAITDIVQGRWQDAIPRLTRAIESMPKAATLYELRAGAYAKLGTHASSERDREQARRLRQAKP